jgi:two-component system KDP operon response regulator KdpE
MTETNALLLIVEDDLQTRRFLKSSLSHKGWRIIEADDGKSGLAMIKNENPDLVILDIGLPDMDGISVTKRLRQISDLPVLILSARSEESWRRKIEQRVK